MPISFSDKSFKQNKQLRTHVRSKHEEKFESEKNKVKKPVEKTVCPICEAKFDKTYLKRHQRQVHEHKKDHKCEHCGKEFFDKKRLNSHIKRRHDKIRDEKCNKCDKVFFTKEVLQKHIKYTHNKELNQRVQHEKMVKKLFECEFCGKTLSTKQNIQNHVKSVHKGIRDVHGKKKKRPKDKKFQCSYCDKMFSDDYDLHRHIKSVHHKIKDHCCDKCGRRFSSPQHLKKHYIKNHGGLDGGQIRYKCDFCIGGKAFKGPGRMEIHLRSTHKIEGPLNIKPEGFDEKMAKKANKLYWKKRKSEMPPELQDSDDENLEKKLVQNPPSLEEQKIALNFGSSKSSVTLTDTNGKANLGELNFIHMRNPEDENDIIEETCIGTGDYVIDVRNMNIEEQTVDEHDDENPYMENEDIDNSNNTELEVNSKIKREETEMDYDTCYEEAYSVGNINDDENEDSKTDEKLEISHSDSSSSEHVPNDEAIDIQATPLNRQRELKKAEEEKEKKFLEAAKGFWRHKMRTQVMDKLDVSEKPISCSKSGTTSSDKEADHKIAEALENLYENFAATHKNKQSFSSSSFDDEENHEQSPEIISDEPNLAIPVLGKMDIELQSQEVKVELEETDEAEQSNNDETEDQELDKKSKIETNGIEIKIDENEVITNRFGHVVDKQIKCNYCDKIYFGKWATKSIRSHCRLVHEAPKLKEAKNEVFNEHLEKDEPSIHKCKFCDKTYVGPHALDSMKYHMKSHSGIHYKCQICEKDFFHKLGSLVWHLQLKHQCENVCEKCEFIFIIISP